MAIAGGARMAYQNGLNAQMSNSVTKPKVSFQESARRALAAVEQIKKDYWDEACQCQKRGFMFRGDGCKCVPCLCDNLLEIIRKDVE